MRRRVLILLSDKILSEFFTLEAQSCGYTVTHAPSELARVACVICDERAFASLDGSAALPMAVLASDADVSFGAATLWQWPIPLEEVRDFLWRAECDVPLSYVESKEPLEEENVLYCSDAPDGEVYYRARPIALTESERKLLLALGDAAGEVVSGEILTALLGGDRNLLSVHMCHLRQKLEEPFGVRMLETVRGKGYRLRIPLIRQ